MAELSLGLFGSISVMLEGQPVVGFKSDKVRALLAYLAVEADRPHRRESLASLLWPDYTDRSASSNFRDILSNLRSVLRDRQESSPFLLISDDTVQFNTKSCLRVDVRTFEADVAAPASSVTVEQLQQAVSLYRGPFLEGFSPKDTAPFEEWAAMTRDRLARLMSSALQRLATHHELHGAYDKAAVYAQRQLQLDPLQEDRHQQLMRVLALNGERSAALAQYDVCRRLLADELGVEPEKKTTELYKAIRDGTFGPAQRQRRDQPHAAPPALIPIVPVALRALPAAPSIVARERELARLDNSLQLSLQGQGQLIFVTGAAGAGKTALLDEFVRRTMQTNSEVVVADGRCNAYTGASDSYLPFREIMQMLTGDVEAKRAAGAISIEHARRLWAAFPDVMRSLVEVAPDTINLLLSGDELVTRASVFAPADTALLTRLENLARRLPDGASSTNAAQPDVFGQYTRLIHVLARQFPLILILDDLQWADKGSIGLLYHLGRRLAGSRVLIVAAYRSDDIVAVESGDRHPLESMVHELRRELGDIDVNLDRADGRRFIDALLDDQPNRLSPSFRDTFYHRTAGQPLFAVESLRQFKEQGDLIRDDAGFWIESTSLDWDRLPARAEAVIAERIGRLRPEWQALLTVASVEGEEFGAEVAAHVLGMEDADVVRILSGPLSAQHIVAASALARAGGRRASRYAFGHYLVQQYLYLKLDEVERAHLHEAVGSAMENLYGDQAAADVAAQLAWHFESAGLPLRAAPYLLHMGERAQRLGAHQEAIAHLTRGLELLQPLPETPERARTELALQLAICTPLQVSESAASPRRGRAAQRAYDLSLEVGTTAQLVQALHVSWSYFHSLGEYEKARGFAEEILRLAASESDLEPAALGHAALAHTAYMLGDFMSSYDHLVAGHRAL